MSEIDILQENPATSLVSPKLKRDTVSNSYNIESVLGEGGFATVYLATCKSTGHEYALKAIAKQEASANLQEVQAEVDVLGNCSHPNIIGLHEIIETQSNYCIIMELVTGGELFDQIASRRSFSEKDARDVTRQVILGLRYLHDNGFVHRDLKPENLLLSTPNEDAIIKIVDFGLTTKYTEPLTETVGTTLYMAPEVVRACEPGAPGYGHASDLWSLGVITYVMLCGWAPFNAPEDSELFELICEGRYCFPEDSYLKLSDEAKDFISSLITVNPDHRMSLEHALQHSWIIAHASEADLDVTRDKIKQMQARKKFKGAITAVKALNKIMKIGAILGKEAPVANTEAAAAQTKEVSAPKPTDPETEKENVKNLVGKFRGLILAQETDKTQKSSLSPESAKAPVKFSCSTQRARSLGLTPNEVKRAVSRFQIWEKNGTVGSKQFFALVTDILTSQGKSSDQALRMAKDFFEEADQDKNGTLDWNEFLEFYAEVMKYL